MALVQFWEQCSKWGIPDRSMPFPYLLYFLDFTTAFRSQKNPSIKIIWVCFVSQLLCSAKQQSLTNLSPFINVKPLANDSTMTNERQIDAYMENYGLHLSSYLWISFPPHMGSENLLFSSENGRKAFYFQSEVFRLTFCTCFGEAVIMYFTLHFRGASFVVDLHF